MTTAPAGEPTSPAVGNEMFLHNMRALWRRDPVLALRVDAVHDDERFPLEPTKSGAWTVTAATSEGAEDLPPQVVTTRSPRRTSLLPRSRWRTSFCFVMVGTGVGLSRSCTGGSPARADAFILCSEPSVPMIATRTDVRRSRGSDRRRAAGVAGGLRQGAISRAHQGARYARDARRAVRPSCTVGSRGGIAARRHHQDDRRVHDVSAHVTRDACDELAHHVQEHRDEPRQLREHARRSICCTTGLRAIRALSSPPARRSPATSISSRR